MAETVHVLDASRAVAWWRAKHPEGRENMTEKAREQAEMRKQKANRSAAQLLPTKRPDGASSRTWDPTQLPYPNLPAQMIIDFP